jgi:hypothetical protein
VEQETFVIPDHLDHVLFMLFMFVCAQWCETRLCSCAAWRVSCKRQELLTLREHMASPPVFDGACVSNLFSFSCCGFLFCLSSSCVLCSQYCQFLWIVLFWLSVRFSLPFYYFFYLPLWYRQTFLEDTRWVIISRNGWIVGNNIWKDMKWKQETSHCRHNSISNRKFWKPSSWTEYHYRCLRFYRSIIVKLWQLNLQVPMSSMPITTKVVSSNSAHGVVYSINIMW